MFDQELFCPIMKGYSAENSPLRRLIMELIRTRGNLQNDPEVIWDAITQYNYLAKHFGVRMITSNASQKEES